MGNQRQNRHGNNARSDYSGGADAFWRMIAPLERLEMRRPDATPRLHPSGQQIERAEELERSQPVLCREIGNPSAVGRADTVQLYPQIRVTPGDVKPVEGRATVEPEPNTQDKSVDVHTSVDEDYQYTRDELLTISNNGRPEPTGSVQPAHQYVSLAEPLNRIQPVESDKSAKEVGAPESKDVNPSPASDEGKISQEPSGGRVERGIWDVGESTEEETETEESDDDEESPERYIGTKGSDGDGESSESGEDTEGSDDDEGSPESEDDTEGPDDEEEYLENNNENDSETVSDASSPAPQRSQYFQGTPRRASARLRELAKKLPKEPSKATTPKRKTAPSQLTSDNRMKQAKRVKRVIEESDYCYEEDDKEDEKGEDSDRRVPHKVNRRARISGQILSRLQRRPPLSRNNLPWTKEEEETLFNLREEGKTWKHIGESVLGRTERTVRYRWQKLRIVASKPIEARTTRDRQSHNSSVISSIARGQLPLLRKPRRDIWTKEEEETLFRLRKQGKTWEYIAESVPGRTLKGAKAHWCWLRRVALKPIEAQTRRRHLPHNSSVESMMAENLKLDYRITWSKEEDDKLISLRTQGLRLPQISRRLQGKGYKAVWHRWQRLKDRYPQVAPDSEESQTDKKGIPSIRQSKSHIAPPSEYDSEESEAEWNVKPESDSAMVERESSESSTDGDPPVDAHVDALSTMHPYRHIASTGTKSNGTLTENHDQRIPKLVAFGQIALPYTKSSVHTESRKELSHGE